MPRNKQLPEGLLSKLHGKGTMSEILDIERSRLLKQSEQDMKRQLGSPDSPDSTSPQPVSSLASIPILSPPPPPAPPVGQPPLHEGQPMPARGESNLAERHDSPLTLASSGRGVPANYPADDPATHSGATDIPQNNAHPGGTFVAVEGLSRFSRVVGDDLSEFGTISRHSLATVSQAPIHSLPKSCQDYYNQIVDPSLPFTAQRNLLSVIRRLTLGWGTLSCQITLELLSATSGIRNLKTVRKWLGDLHDKKHIRYTPVHGDLRGSIITLTPPQGLLAAIDQWRRERVSSGDSVNFPARTPQSGDRHGL